MCIRFSPPDPFGWRWLPGSSRGPTISPKIPTNAARRRLSRFARREEARRRGMVTHRVLQHLDFSAATDAGRVASELHRMEAEGVLNGDEHALVDQTGIEWFVCTPLAGAIRRAGNAYRREFQYIATEPPEYFDRSIGSGSTDDVLVRGIVDGILPVADGIEIVDFKTDALRPEDVPARRERYRPQMELYARAMSRIWRRPVRACWLVFLGVKELVELRDLTLE